MLNVDPARDSWLHIDPSQAQDSVMCRARSHSSIYIHSPVIPMIDPRSTLRETSVSIRRTHLQNPQIKGDGVGKVCCPDGY